MNYIKSPLNYMGGKFKLLSQILPLFPKNIHTFVDVFGGGCNVASNVEAKQFIYNDQIVYLSHLFQFLKTTPADEIIDGVEKTIEDFNLLSVDNGRDGFNALRERYNQDKKSLDLLVLIFFSFNHQLRFNNKREFNTSWGKLTVKYNPTLKNNLKNFTLKLQEKDFTFENKDFTELAYDNLNENDFVYFDPPYIISNATYNDGKRGFKNWTIKEEQALLDLCDELNKKNIKFAISNVLSHKGETNDLLIEWSKKYNVHYLDKQYLNSNYQKKDKISKSTEVLITNY